MADEKGLPSEPVNPVAMWLIIAGIGVASMLGLAVYGRVLVKSRK